MCVNRPQHSLENWLKSNRLWAWTFRLLRAFLISPQHLLFHNGVRASGGETPQAGGFLSMPAVLYLCSHIQTGAVRDDVMLYTHRHPPHSPVVVKAPEPQDWPVLPVLGSGRERHVRGVIYQSSSSSLCLSAPGIWRSHVPQMYRNSLPSLGPFKINPACVSLFTNLICKEGVLKKKTLKKFSFDYGILIF